LAKTIQDQGWEPEPFSGGTMLVTFSPGGRMHIVIDTMFGALETPATYPFEGKNVSTS
jgi:hypothetical protein